MKRRSFLESGLALAAASVVPRLASAQQSAAPGSMSGWRPFEVTSRIEIVDAGRSTRAWLPLPSLEEPPPPQPGAGEFSLHAPSREITG